MVIFTFTFYSKRMHRIQLYGGGFLAVTGRFLSNITGLCMLRIIYKNEIEKFTQNKKVYLSYIKFTSMQRQISQSLVKLKMKHFSDVSNYFCVCKNSGTQAGLNMIYLTFCTLLFFNR